MRFLTLGLALFLASTLRADPVPPSHHVREVHVRVLDPQGRPARQRAVSLIGLSRFSMRPGDGAAPDWDFRTDDQGACTVRLWDRKTADFGPQPGWGTYALRVEASRHDAGAFSPYIIHENDAQWAKQTAEGRGRLEWGKPVILSGDRLNLRLQIRKGFMIKGRVVSYPGAAKPLRGVTVSAGYDLYAETHTGFGAEISGPAPAITDLDGEFTLTHVYPSKCYLSISGPAKELNWVRTKVGRRWHEDALDAVTAPAKSAPAYREIMAADRPSFRYFGRIETAGRQPIRGAKITFGVSSHRQPRTWDDDHHYEDTTSDGDGNYSILLETPFVRGYSVEATGDQRFDLWIDDSSDREVLSPGRHNVRLRPAGAAKGD